MADPLDRRPHHGSRWLAATCAGLTALLAALAPQGAMAQPNPGVQPAGTGMPLAQPVAIFGRDDRVALAGQQDALRRSIGLLVNARARTVCTAFCVADDTIATAAHCMFRTAGEPMPRTEDFRFERGHSDPRQRARIAGFANRSAFQHVVSGSTSLSVRPPIDATRDWALARLAAPVCRGHALRLAPAADDALAEAARDNRLLLAGYHRDVPAWRPAISRNCELRRLEDSADADSVRRDFIDPDQLILHTCDTGGASSGSPLLVETASGPVVVGINVGTYVQSKVVMQNGEVVHRFKASEIANTAVSIAAPAAMLPLLREAEVLTSGPGVSELQRRLAGLGLYGGPVDGLHGVTLRTAIEGLERAEQLPATGLPTRALLARLGGDAMLLTGSIERTGTVRPRRLAQRRGR